MRLLAHGYLPYHGGKADAWHPCFPLTRGAGKHAVA